MSFRKKEAIARTIKIVSFQMFNVPRVCFDDNESVFSEKLRKRTSWSVRLTGSSASELLQMICISAGELFFQHITGMQITLLQ